LLRWASDATDQYAAIHKSGQSGITLKRAAELLKSSARLRPSKASGGA
jgi:hypothetical protein